jgi:hypothetical protein
VSCLDGVKSIGFQRPSQNRLLLPTAIAQSDPQVPLTDAFITKLTAGRLNVGSQRSALQDSLAAITPRPRPLQKPWGVAPTDMGNLLSLVHEHSLLIDDDALLRVT